MVVLLQGNLGDQGFSIILVVGGKCITTPLISNLCVQPINGMLKKFRQYNLKAILVHKIRSLYNNHGSYVHVS